MSVPFGSEWVKAQPKAGSPLAAGDPCGAEKGWWSPLICVSCISGAGGLPLVFPGVDKTPQTVWDPV